jgi:hypothetical protein
VRFIVEIDLIGVFWVIRVLTEIDFVAVVLDLDFLRLGMQEEVVMRYRTQHPKMKSKSVAQKKQS